jgi:hypothetical protein
VEENNRWPGRYDESIRTIELTSWEQFDRWVREMLDYRGYVWRGHASDQWLLEPTLDRILKKRGRLTRQKLRTDHLERFKLATRGRRGLNPPLLVSDNDWWALGQHHGLATPLLDWTTSPYVAAYFAFASEDNDGANNRAIMAISRSGIRKKSEDIQSTWTHKSRAPIIEFIQPYSDENPRLVSQGGLFSRGPDEVDLEQWIRKHLDHADRKVRLYKITIPNTERIVALRSLNRMNINHLSLFPDLYGASKFVNMDLLITKY